MPVVVPTAREMRPHGPCGQDVAAGLVGAEPVLG